MFTMALGAGGDVDWEDQAEKVESKCISNKR